MAILVNHQRILQFQFPSLLDSHRLLTDVVQAGEPEVMDDPTLCRDSGIEPLVHNMDVLEEEGVQRVGQSRRLGVYLTTYTGQCNSRAVQILFRGAHDLPPPRNPVLDRPVQVDEVVKGRRHGVLEDGVSDLTGQTEQRRVFRVGDRPVSLR